MPWALHARNRAQVLVNGAKIVIVHVLIGRPRHDLQQRAVEGRIQLRVQLIGIDTGPDGVTEFFERVAADRQPRLVRRQVAGNDVDRRGRARERTKSLPPPRYVSGLICSLPEKGGLEQVRVAVGVGRELRLRTGRMTAVTLPLGVDDVAAEADERAGSCGGD